MSTPNAIMELLRNAGLDADAALASLRAAKKEATDERKEQLSARKEANYDLVGDLAKDFRLQLELAFADVLPGSHLNLTVRKDKDGNIVATANDCHSTGNVISIHVNADGVKVFGPEGALDAKNVRPRKKSE